MSDYDWFKVQRVTVEGKAVERTTFDRIGFNEARTELIDHADGSQTLVKTRNGNPLITSIPSYSTTDTADQAVTRSYLARVFPGPVWAGVIRKVKGIWSKFKKETLYGAYTLYPRWTKGQTYPDTYVVKDGALYINGVKFSFKKLTGETALPVVIPATNGYPNSAQSDADDYHLLLLDSTKASHLPGRLKNDTPSELFSTATLDATAIAYSRAEWSAGVEFSHTAGAVAYNKWYMSPALALAQRAVLFDMQKQTPYLSQRASLTRNFQATAYVFPVGSMSDTTGSIWQHAVTPNDLGLMAQYAKTGTPTVFPSYGTLAFEGWYQGSPVQTVTSHDYNYSGNGSYSESYSLGYYNGAELPVSLSMTATTTYLRRESTGSVAVANANFIMPANQSSSPPSYSFQMLTIADGAAGPGGGGWGPGEYVGPSVASSVSTTKTWTSTSVMQCVSPTLGDLFFARVVVSGNSDHAEITNSTAPAYGGKDGSVIGLASSDQTPYYTQYNAIKQLTGYLEPSRIVETSTVDVQATYSRTLDGKTKDYILFDAENSAYVYLETVFAGHLPTPDGSGGTFSFVMNLVVEYSGGKFTDELVQFTGGSPLLPTDAVIDSARYFAPLMPPRVFAPPHCKQGTFKHVAYSELADIAPEGVAPTDEAAVFLMSLPLSLSAPQSEVKAPDNSFNFVPWNFYSFVGGFTGLSVAAALRPVLEGIVFYKHFADGAFVDWTVDQSVIYDPHYSEIYRT